MGALVSFVGLDRTAKRTSTRALEDVYNNPITSFALSLAGVFLLFVSLGLITEKMAFPGAWALLPTTGALLTIAAGPKAWINRTLLSSRPMVYLGLIIYPLYLWHWPMLVFARFMTRSDAWLVTSISVVASLVLSYVTYKIIEKPLRDH
jgi:peptidoglycan/LPS O-acetylase OafA/YrhL